MLLVISTCEASRELICPDPSKQGGLAIEKQLQNVIGYGLDEYGNPVRPKESTFNISSDDAVSGAFAD